MNPKAAAAQGPKYFYQRLTLNPYGMDMSSKFPKSLKFSWLQRLKLNYRLFLSPSSKWFPSKRLSFKWVVRNRLTRYKPKTALFKALSTTPLSHGKLSWQIYILTGYATEKLKFNSVIIRPWALSTGTTTVPNIIRQLIMNKIIRYITEHHINYISPYKYICISQWNQDLFLLLQQGLIVTPLHISYTCNIRI